MHEIRVGELYVAGRTSWPEAIEWNWAKDLNELRLFFTNPSSQEIQAVKRGKVEFGLVVRQDIIFLAFRFLPAPGNQQGIPWSDAPYTYHMLPQDRKGLPEADPGPEERSLLQIVLVDAGTGVSLAIRGVTLSPEFTQKMFAAIRAQAEQPFNQQVYDQHLRGVYTTYQSKQLYSLARARCTGGQ